MFRVRRKKGFTLFEVIIVTMVVGFVAFLALRMHAKNKERAESLEALVYSGAIKQGEEFHKHQTGSYVALDDTEEINERLSIGIKPQFYEFRVVVPEEDKFLIIAERIGKEIKISLDGKFPRSPDLVVVSNEGMVGDEYDDYITQVIYANAGEDESDSSAYRDNSDSLVGLGGGSRGGSRGTSGGGGDFGGGISISGGGGSGGGSTGSSGSSNTSSIDNSGFIGGEGDTFGGGNVTTPPPEQTFDSDIISAFNLLNGSSNGQYYYDLINAKNISVIYDDFSKYPVSDLTLAFWWGVANNTIYVNQNLKTTVPETAIAAVIVHEATHADYEYNPEKAIAETLTRHPELSRSDIGIDRDPDTGEEIIYNVYDPETDTVKQQVYINNSIDQEYSSFANELEVWKEIKGDTTSFEDDDLIMYEQGEAVLKANLRTRGSYSTLPEY